MLLQILLKEAPLPLHTLEYWKDISLQLQLVWFSQVCQRIYASSPRPNYHHAFPKGAMRRFPIWVLPLLERPRDFPTGWGAVLQLMADWRAGRNTVTWQKNVMDEKMKRIFCCYHAFRLGNFGYSTSVLKSHHTSLIGNTYLQTLRLLALLMLS